MYLKSITFDSVDFTEFCKKGSTEIQLTSNGRMSTARLVAEVAPLTSPAPLIPAAQQVCVITGNRYADGSQCAVNGSFEDKLTGWDLFNDVDAVGRNYLRYSEDLTQVGVWPRSAGVTVTGNYANDPNGAATADRVQFPDANRVIQQLAASLPAGTYIGRIWVKGAVGETIRIGLTREVPLLAVETNYTLTGNWDEITTAAVTTTGTGYVSLAVSTFGGATARDILAWGAQLNPGATALGYAKTEASAYAPYDGNQAARIPSNQGVQAGLSQLLTQVLPGQTVTVSAYVRPNTNGTHYQFLGFQAPDGSDAGSFLSTPITPGSGWQLATYSRIVPDGASRVGVYPAFLNNDATTGEFDVDAVTISVDDIEIFRGRISRVEPKVTTDRLVRYSIAAQDNTRTLDAITVTSKSYTSQNDSAILADLISTYGGSPAVITAGNIQTVDSIEQIEFDNISLRTCIERIAERTGAEWRINMDGSLDYYALGDVAGLFDFSDNPDEVDNTYVLLSDLGYQEEFSSPANVVSVLGYHEPQGPDETVTLQITGVNDDASVYYIDGAFPPSGGSGFADSAADPNILYHAATSGPVYTYGQVLMRFDTSVIPDDATVLSATLKCWMRRGADTVDTNSMRVCAEYYTWTPAASTANYTNTVPTSPDAIQFWPSKQLTPSVYVERTMALSNPASINKTGFTGLRFHIEKTTTADPTPGVSNNIEIVSRDNADATRRPVLTITYRPARAAQITGSHTDAASVAAYGEFRRTITDESIKTTADADQRAQTETAIYGYPIQSINCTFDRDGLRVGDTVTFSSQLLAVNGSFVVKEIRMKWPGGPDLTRYTATLGQFRPDLIQLLRKRL